MRFTHYLPFLLAFALVACEGEMGPAGPEGPAGPQGPQGPPGNPAIYVTEVSYSINAAANGWGSNTWTWQALTQSVIDDGAVLAYLDNGSGEWFSLPLTLVTADLNYQFSSAVGAFALYIANGENVSYSESGTLKVVAIEGGLGNLRLEEPPPYEELAARLRLPLD